MGKKREVTNVYVKVEPETRHLWATARTPERLRDICKDIEDEIKRHVDNVGWIGIEQDVEETCEFCGYPWSGGDGPHNHGCCEQDEAVLNAEAKS